MRSAAAWRMQAAQKTKARNSALFYLQLFKYVFAGCLQFLRLFQHPAVFYALAHDVRMLLRRHRRRSH